MRELHLLQLVGERVKLAVVVAGDVLDPEAAQRHVPLQPLAVAHRHAAPRARLSLGEATVKGLERGALLQRRRFRRRRRVLHAERPRVRAALRKLGVGHGPPAAAVARDQVHGPRRGPVPVGTRSTHLRIGATWPYPVPQLEELLHPKSPLALLASAVRRR